MYNLPFGFNSQMVPSLLATLTIVELLQLGKNVQAKKNPWVLQQRRARDGRTVRWLPLSVRLPSGDQRNEEIYISENKIGRLVAL